MKLYGDVEEHTNVRCPMGERPGGEVVVLGMLGGLTWFRCRQCGYEWPERWRPSDVYDHDRYDLTDEEW